MGMMELGKGVRALEQHELDAVVGGETVHRYSIVEDDYGNVYSVDDVYERGPDGVLYHVGQTVTYLYNKWNHDQN